MFLEHRGGENIITGRRWAGFMEEAGSRGARPWVMRDFNKHEGDQGHPKTRNWTKALRSECQQYCGQQRLGLARM